MTSKDENRPTVPARTAVTLPTPAERDRVIAALSDAFAHGTLDVEELERRVTLAQTFSSRTQLEELTHDLPASSQAAEVAPKAELVPVSQVKEKGRLIGIMGGVQRQGAWTVPRQLDIVAIMGGAVLDFRDARLPAGPVDIRITALMGGVEIIVPPHLAVEAGGTAIMGGFEQVDRTPQNPDPEAPLLRIEGFAFMGGVHIDMRLPGETRRDAEKRRRHERRAVRRLQGS